MPKRLLALLLRAAPVDLVGEGAGEVAEPPAGEVAVEEPVEEPAEEAGDEAGAELKVIPYDVTRG